MEHIPSFDTFRAVIGTLVKHNPVLLHDGRCTDMITVIMSLMGKEGYLHGLSSNPDGFINICLCRGRGGVKITGWIHSSELQRRAAGDADWLARLRGR